ncbi:MAG: DUF2147 domain-containing protein [Flavobacteriaceae bacterium]|jgi:uncharacterized protein (DUF2147 family)|nr:DUF2147 domain-containing protein [Flavobacteriaceae bacterium]MDG1912647.1 DUF2147 domain-containing protein [Flavobacteriaceae bacterium]
MAHFLLFIAYIFFNTIQPSSVEGVWITQDDETGQKKSEVLLYEENGKLYGKILKLLLPGDQGKLCKECKGDNKNKPIEGLVIVNDLLLDDGTWEDGTILDPKSGKVYDCYITLVDDNNLDVRGFLGFSILGRTQKWIRK